MLSNSSPYGVIFDLIAIKYLKKVRRSSRYSSTVLGEQFSMPSLYPANSRITPGRVLLSTSCLGLTGMFSPPRWFISNYYTKLFQKMEAPSEKFVISLAVKIDFRYNIQKYLWRRVMEFYKNNLSKISRLIITHIAMSVFGLAVGFSVVMSAK